MKQPKGSDLPARFREELRASRLIPRATPVVVALSGGGDSTALLHLLARSAPALRFTLAAAVHVHHGIRGEEADRDAAAAESAARALGVPFELDRCDVPGEARRTGRSTEETARRLRYAILRRAAARRPDSLIATGHTADDRFETLLLALDRGAGASSLGGPRRRRDDGVVRPLLPFRRAELRAWLRAEGIPWVDDSTNDGGAGTGRRARLRRQLEPLLGEMGDGFLDRAGRSLDDLLHLAEWLDRETARLAPDDPAAPLDAAGLARLPRPLSRPLLRRLAEAGGIPPPSSRLLDDLLSALPGDRRPRLFVARDGSGFLLAGGRVTVERPPAGDSPSAGPSFGERPPAAPEETAP